MSPRAEEIAALLAYREAEGLTYAELAEETGVAKATLSWWSWRLRRDSQQGFAEVVVGEEADVGDDSTGVSILAGGIAIQIERDFDAGTLAQVLKIVIERC
jgi:hypothetical protein